PEIWDFGLRNPWRFSFDRATHDLWIGDVGGSQREEVDYEPAGRGGRNYGWNRMEGSVTFKGGPAPGLVPPILDYSHSGGACVVTGGYVYRGARIPALRGAYLYGDFCTGRIDAVREPGDILVLEGQRGREFFVILSGQAAVMHDDDTVATLRTGDWFGELALLANAPRNATVAALTPMELFVLDDSEFSALLRELPQL